MPEKPLRGDSCANQNSPGQTFAKRWALYAALGAPRIELANWRLWTKSLSEKPGCVVGDVCACEMEHGEIVLNFLLPADEESSEPVHP